MAHTSPGWSITAAIDWCLTYVRGCMMGDDEAKDGDAAASPPQTKQAGAFSESGSDFIIVKANLNVSAEWRDRLRSLDDYQRSASYVFGKLRLG